MGYGPPILFGREIKFFTELLPEATDDGFWQRKLVHCSLLGVTRLLLGIQVGRACGLDVALDGELHDVRELRHVHRLVTRRCRGRRVTSDVTAIET